MSSRLKLNQKAFTLLETLIAIGLLATALLMLAQSWSGSFVKLRKTQENFTMAALLERKMMEIGLEYKDKTLDEIPEEKADEFSEDFPQYKWELKSQKLEMPNMTDLLMAQQENGADTQLLAVFNKFGETLSKAIKEVKVTVIFTPKSGKPIKKSATTYFINYEAQLAP